MQESLDKALILKEQGNAYFKSDQTQKGKNDVFVCVEINDLSNEIVS